MNKLIVITGGTKGIGRAIAEKFAKEKYNVAVCARNKAELKLMSEIWQNRFPNSILFTFKADVCSKNQLQAFTNHLVAKFTQIDVIVNNAGVYFPGEVLTSEEGALEKMIETNLYSAYNFTRMLMPTIVKQPGAHIFNMCSVASIMAYPNGGAYCISKFALMGFSKCLREELKSSNIKVTAVLPGATWSNSWAGVDLPKERLMDASDIADTIFAAANLSRSAVIEELIIRPQQGDL
jgi:short-subunit dehydrogenase